MTKNKKITEYYYPEHSPFQTIDLKICPILKMFVLKISHSHIVKFILYKNGNFFLESSKPISTEYKGLVEIFASNWTENVFNIEFSDLGSFSIVLKLNLGIQISIRFSILDFKKFSFFTSFLDDRIEYFRPSAYLGFTKTFYFNKTLYTVKQLWNDKKELVSVEKLKSESFHPFRNQSIDKILDYIFLSDRSKTISNKIKVSRFILDSNSEDDCDSWISCSSNHDRFGNL